MAYQEFYIIYGEKQEAGESGLAFALSDIIEEFNLTDSNTEKIKEILDYHGITYGY